MSSAQPVRVQTILSVVITVTSATLAGCGHSDTPAVTEAGTQPQVLNRVIDIPDNGSIREFFDVCSRYWPSLTPYQELQNRIRQLRPSEYISMQIGNDCWGTYNVVYLATVPGIGLVMLSNMDDNSGGHIRETSLPPFVFEDLKARLLSTPIHARSDATPHSLTQQAHGLGASFFSWQLDGREVSVRVSPTVMKEYPFDKRHPGNESAIRLTEEFRSQDELIRFLQDLRVDLLGLVGRSVNAGTGDLSERNASG